MNDLTIMRTVAQFDTFDTQLVTAHCRAGEEEVTAFLENHHYLFERAGGRHSAGPTRLRIRDRDAFERHLAELGTEQPSSSAGTATGLTNQLKVLEGHLLATTSTVREAVQAPPDLRPGLAAQVEAGLQQSLDVLRGGTP